MKTVAFFLENAGHPFLDYSNVELGNPGVGGSEYMIVLVATLLAKRNNGINVVLYTDRKSNFHECLLVKYIDSLASAIEDADLCKVDFIVFKAIDVVNSDYLRKTRAFTKLIPWFHNFATIKELKWISQNDVVYRAVTVGKHQLLKYLDHKAYKKSCYIYNCVNTDVQERYNVSAKSFENRPNRVCYIGSLIPAKGFHWLAEIWPSVVSDVSDAELYVIGTGRLYSRDSKLGQYGLTEEHYEKYIMKYLAPNGKILPSVHFLGLMGECKNEILKTIKVGVPNPSGNTETFGITAVEMQLMGAKIATMSCPGYLDTVYNGILYKKKSQLKQSIVNLLKTKENKEYDYVVSNIKKEFCYETVAKKWEQLFLSEMIDENLAREGDFLRRFLYRLKSKMPFLHFLIPSVFFIESKISGLKRKLYFLVGAKSRINRF